MEWVVSRLVSDQHRVGEQQESARADDIPSNSRSAKTVADVFIRWRRSDLDLHAKLHHALRRQSEECCRSYRVPSHQDE
jgi:hypothetical protein